MLMSQPAATTEAGDARGAAIAAGQLVGVLEKIGKVTGEIATIARGTINIQNNVAIVNSPQFAKVPAARHHADRLSGLPSFEAVRSPVRAEPKKPQCKAGSSSALLYWRYCQARHAPISGPCERIPTRKTGRLSRS
jgi:hypothetical protein